MKKTGSRYLGLILGLVGVLTLQGCENPERDGIPFTLTLPTNTQLDLHCADAGIAGETCVLDDPANIFRNVVITEVDVNNPGAASEKFTLANAIPPGPTGAKARFYLWATALAKFPSGENQYYTALALHEVFDANSDVVIQEQALKAYRAVLDNFYGSVTYFGPFGPSNVFIPVQLNLIVGDNLYRPAATGFAALHGTPLEAEADIGSWGYTYEPCTALCPDDGLLYVSGVP